MGNTALLWILLVVLLLLITMPKFYRRFFATANPDLLPFVVDRRAIIIDGPKWAVEKAHNQNGDPTVNGLHGNIDHRTQIEARDYEKLVWWSLFLYSPTWRKEIHVVRDAHFDKAILLLKALKDDGLPIEVSIREMNGEEQKITAQSEWNKQMQYYREGKLPRPPKRKRFWTVIGGSTDLVTPVKKTQSLRQQRRK